MGATDYGTQEITYNFRQSAQAINFNRLMYKLVNSGIYTWTNKDSGAEPLTKVNDTTVTVAPMTMYIKDSGTDDNAVRIATSAAFNVNLSDYGTPTTVPYIIWRFDWSSALNNFADCLAVAYENLTSTDIIIGRCNFSGGVMIDIDYSRQSLQTNDVPAEFFQQVQVLATEPITNKILIANDLTMNTHVGRITLSAQTLSTGAGSGGGVNDVADGFERKDIVWVGFDYAAKTATLEVTEGSEVGSNAVAPNYGDKFVLAELYRAASGADNVVVIGPEITMNNLNQIDVQPTTEGSALVYFQSAAPTEAPDGTTLGTIDEGRKWIDSDTLYEYVWNGSAWLRTLNGVSGGTENNLISIDASGHAKDSGTTDPNQSLTTTSNPTFNGLITTGDIMPNSNNTRDLGSNATRFALIYGNNIYSSSSRKTKRNIKPFPDIALDLILDTEIIEYQYKNKKRYKVGFIAEETSEILAPDHCNMDHTNVMGVLMKAVQELSSQVENLQIQINEMHNDGK